MTSDSFHCVGLDLAWGMTARTGVALVDSEGRLITSSSMREDKEIADFLQPYADSIRSAAIDAPLVIKNQTGMRPCERQISSAFGRYGASAYPANLGNPHFVAPRGARLADEFGWNIDPVVRPSSGRPTGIEVYPHPAMVSLFGLGQTIKYKAGRGRTVIDRQSAFEVLMGHMETRTVALRLADHPRWLDLRSVASHATRPVELERIEDEIDAIFCAHLAWLWVTAPEQLMVFGDLDTGYIVTPPAPAFPQTPLRGATTSKGSAAASVPTRHTESGAVKPRTGSIRAAEPDDVPAILGLVRELAVYEKEPHAVEATEDDFRVALFPTAGAATAFAHVAEVDGEIVGMALWYVTFSTWLGRGGIWLEDLYVSPEHRGSGLGKALLATLSAVCAERGYGRLEWWVLRWNKPSIGFYDSIGGQPMDEWLTYRLEGRELAALVGDSAPSTLIP